MSASPVNMTLHRKSRTLEILWDDAVTHLLPCELLRVYSPSAEVRGHTPDQAVLVTGKKRVGVARMEMVGSYAIRLCFDDDHDTGLYTWSMLRDLGEQREAHWKDYLIRLKTAGASRESEASKPPDGDAHADQDTVVGGWQPLSLPD